MWQKFHNRVFIEASHRDVHVAGRRGESVEALTRSGTHRV